MRDPTAQELQDAVDAAYVALLLSSEITPGEWRVAEMLSPTLCAVDADARYVVSRFVGPQPEREANAQAIAAVPQMMRALRAIAEHNESYDCLPFQVFWNTVRLHKIEHGTWVDLDRCRAILAQGAAAGIKPSSDAIERMMG